MKPLIAALALGLVGTSAAHAQSQITGAGATFPAPVYTKWGEAAKAALGIELNYQAIGSGGGQNQILQRTVDFGASDAPMAPEKLETGKLLQFPTVMGAVVIIVNLPDIDYTLNLDTVCYPVTLTTDATAEVAAAVRDEL